ncbi:uncharacterized protein TNCV_2047521 [Trichonephila clavipes]|uniref:Integrase zinc-binding domain-containing protein n=1 Tax=Trichonephila clavipes TaxID=2585209 RepID=A0A8X6SU87_TRICX|nr:uncharacterized protein TNCV_2047521 [Trichonephila clavipes]
MDIDQSVESKTQTLAPSKILGVAWNPDQDTFYFNTGGIIKFLKKRTNTKRCLLQAAGRIFDPVGFLSPFIIRLKILIQELWCLGLDWDEFFPKNLESSWNEWCKEVPELNTFSIPRYYLGYALQNEIDNIQIHCFSDSSKKAYGTVVYLRIALKNGKTFTNFVASKCRVAPLKTISLPRLELMGALLSPRLSYKISKTINYITSSYFWTDSSITYFWIKGSAARFKPFVKNRIQEIQKYTDSIEWRHCPGKDNPANLLLENESSWPKALDFSKEIDIEQIGKYELRKETMTEWCLRFVNNSKINISERKKDYLNTTELRNAAKVLVKSVQQSEFKSEIKCLQLKHQIPKNSKILSLNPFLDKDGLLRVGGRLKFSNLSDSQKHQLILPKTHHLTDLIIIHFHKISLHSGTQTTLFLIRQYYWIPSGQNRVRRVINRCLTCFQTRIRTVNQMMGDLPKDRVVPSRPFEKVGLDFAGPIITKPNLKRSTVTLKSYIAIFICFCTKATHFEVVSDLTTDSFLASLRRFVARRSQNQQQFGIEAVLNSQPLCPLSADPAYLQPLTPGQFLSLKNRFWKRWSKEYLGELQARKKWKLPLSNLKLGQLVMLKEPSKIPMEWTLGRIEGIHPGSDGLVRIIRIRTSRGVFTRTAASVCPLPFEDVGPPSNGGQDVPLVNTRTNFLLTSHYCKRMHRYFCS